MPKYLLSYDLDKPGPQNYERIINEIKRLGGVEVLRSQWVIVNEATAGELRDHFKGFINTTSDRLIINGFDVVSWCNGSRFSPA